MTPEDKKLKELERQIGIAVMEVLAGAGVFPTITKHNNRRFGMQTEDGTRFVLQILDVSPAANTGG